LNVFYPIIWTAMKRTLLLTISFCFAFNYGIAQDASKVKPANLKESSAERGPGEADQYNFLDKKIFTALKGNKIPVDFPKYNAATMTEQQYKQTCRAWLAERPELCSAEYLQRQADQAARKH
jgi:hypothetical protein